MNNWHKDQHGSLIKCCYLQLFNRENWFYQVRKESTNRYRIIEVEVNYKGYSTLLMNLNPVLD